MNWRTKLRQTAGALGVAYCERVRNLRLGSCVECGLQTHPTVRRCLCGGEIETEQPTDGPTDTECSRLSVTSADGHCAVAVVMIILVAAAGLWLGIEPTTAGFGGLIVTGVWVGWLLHTASPDATAEMDR